MPLLIIISNNVKKKKITVTQPFKKYDENRFNIYFINESLPTHWDT